jgi:hypothetical protein
MILWEAQEIGPHRQDVDSRITARQETEFTNRNYTVPSELHFANTDDK